MDLRFAGNMERQQTDSLLKQHASGTYLIRERPAEAERFAISIKSVAHEGQLLAPPRGTQGLFQKQEMGSHSPAGPQLASRPLLSSHAKELHMA